MPRKCAMESSEEHGANRSRQEAAARSPNFFCPCSHAMFGTAAFHRQGLRDAYEMHIYTMGDKTYAAEVRR